MERLRMDDRVIVAPFPSTALSEEVAAKPRNRHLWTEKYIYEELQSVLANCLDWKRSCSLDHWHEEFATKLSASQQAPFNVTLGGLEHEGKRWFCPIPTWNNTLQGAPN